MASGSALNLSNTKGTIKIQLKLIQKSLIPCARCIVDYALSINLNHTNIIYGKQINK